ncbi:MAG: orotate phosphoribosyltransferase [Caldicoprobacter oshimai]|uniref:Orotate phosphoribosyltransferase n=1 Tax=Caldicoprobacter faecalis TaxID=937334 RepID=A0A1I5SDD8_9FIRM|nr:orotate phosphoribosyltransferase [Caldicoprobacter faecalis]PZN11362.1 MAG: orotate phosphoribosyltransferase [Caldicoprobacter oshimai]SFP68750.1 orotate phosphoribosyltransferase [Caldicoprobacter faecalis]
MDRERVLQIFRETGVLLQGHFLLTSGRHSGEYLQCAKVFQYPRYAEEITRALADKFKDDRIDIVVGPAIGGIILSYEMGRCLGIKTIFAEREDGKMTLRRGFEIPEGSRVLVVEDVVTTGGSVKEVMEVVKNCGGEVVGVGAVVDRSGGNVDFGVKFHSVISMDVKSYAPEECPICRTGLPLVKPGSRNIGKSQE